MLATFLPLQPEMISAHISGIKSVTSP